MTGAFELWRVGMSRVLDAAGLTLLAVLTWRMFFAFDLQLQAQALVVGVVGLLARWTNPDAARPSAWPMLAYIAVVLLSAAIHNWSRAAAAGGFPIGVLFGPAWHVVVMGIFVLGAGHLLQTRWRLSIWTVLMVVAVAVFASQIVFDRASSGFVYNRAGAGDLPSVAQWSGLFGNSLVLVLGLPLVLSAALVSRVSAFVGAGLVLTIGLFLAAYVNGSRGGALAMLITGFLMVCMTVVSRGVRSWRDHLKLLAAGLVLGAVVAGLSAGRLSMPRFDSLSGGRWIIWETAGRMTRDHLWVGVGPGNYAAALEAGHYADSLINTDAGLYNAHNLFVHTAAETGVIGLAGLLVFLAWLVRSSWRASRASTLPIITFGLMFALVAFLAHSVSENFLDARAEVERTRLIVWMIFAAVVAASGLTRRAGSAP